MVVGLKQLQPNLLLLSILQFMNNFNCFLENASFEKMPFIIAEVGVNHEGSLELAKRLIDEAAEGGADAVKFQTYKADTLVSKDSPCYWDTTKEPCLNQHQLFSKYDRFMKNDYETLKAYCDRVGITFCSTPFDVESATFLNDLMPFYKISSSDITNKPFIEFLCSFGKPILLSTGASFIEEVHKAVGWVDPAISLILLHCVLNYPTSNANANLGAIRMLQREFPNHIIGYSDHTLPGDMEVLQVATLMGAKVLEKHFTHDKSLPGNDHYHAMDKSDLKKFKKFLTSFEELLGVGDYRDMESQQLSREHARRSLVLTRAMKAGEVIEKADLTWKRPAMGISPDAIEEVVGKAITCDLAEDSVLKWIHLNTVK